MKIIFASNNTHKRSEIQRLLPHCSICLPQEIGYTFHCAEVGKTFIENSLQKAETCLNLIKQRYAVIADDSGICVDALRGRPGIYSARYGTEDGVGVDDDAARNQMLLRELQAKKNRSAYYVCAATLITKEGRICIVQERWHGHIVQSASAGKNGFGYDPIFFAPEIGKIVADLTVKEKDTFSHRGKAIRAIAHFLTK